MSYEISPCVTYWFGMIQGHTQAMQLLALRDTMTYSEKAMFESSIRSIRGSCEAITKQLDEAKEVK